MLDDPALKYFDASVSDRERAIFEGAIALAMIYHKFTGIPLSDNEQLISAIKKAIQLSSTIQPFKKKVKVEINKVSLKKKMTPYDYTELSGRDMDVRVTTRYGDAEATVRLSFIKELNYPLMYIERVKSSHGIQTGKKNKSSHQ